MIYVGPEGSPAAEIWKFIKDFPLYEISNLGRVKSHIGRCKILKPSVVTGGYYHVVLCRSGKRFSFLVHRLVLQAFTGPCPPEWETNHKDGVKSNNKISNLEWISRGLNQVHAYALGLRTQNGEAHHNVKLKNGDITKIRKLAMLGFSHTQIAEKFPVSRRHVCDIINHKKWKHI